jgi:HEAT repeat protein
MYPTYCLVIGVCLIGDGLADQISDLISQLKNPSPERRRLAAEQLGSNPENGEKVVAALIMALKGDKDDIVRAAAAQALGKSGARSRDAVSALVEALNDEVAGVAVAAERALATIGKPAVPALVKLIESKTERKVVTGLTILIAIGPAAKDAIPSIRTLLSSNDLAFKLGAARALVTIDPTDATADRALLELLKLPDEQRDSRLRAAEILSLRGSKGKDAVPLLRKTLRETRDDRIQARMMFALWSIGPEAKAAIPDLLSLANPGNKGTDTRAICAGVVLRLDPMNDAAKGALKEEMAHLIALTSKDSVWLVQLGAETLGSLGSEGRAGLPALKEILKHPSPEVRNAVKVAIEKIEAKK